MQNIVARRRGLATLAAAGAVAITGGALISLAAPAMAATTDTGGSATETVDSTFASQLAGAHVNVVAHRPATITCGRGPKTVSVPVTGGNASAVSLSGTMDFGGSFTFAREHKEVTFSNLQLNYRTAEVSGTAADGTQVALAKLGGVLKHTVNGNNEEVSSTMLLLDAAGASYLDANLGTTVFTGGENTGSFDVKYTTTTS